MVKVLFLLIQVLFCITQLEFKSFHLLYRTSGLFNHEWKITLKYKGKIQIIQIKTSK